MPSTRKATDAARAAAARFTAFIAVLLSLAAGFAATMMKRTERPPDADLPEPPEPPGSSWFSSHDHRTRG